MSKPARISGYEWTSKGGITLHTNTGAVRLTKSEYPRLAGMMLCDAAAPGVKTMLVLALQAGVAQGLITVEQAEAATPSRGQCRRTASNSPRFR